MKWEWYKAHYEVVYGIFFVVEDYHIKHIKNKAKQNINYINIEMYYEMMMQYQ